MSSKPMPEWELVLSAAAHLQRIVPDAVLVGGTAAASYAKHRFSRDADHVLTDLRDRFDQVLADLEAVAGWQTARVNRPVLILGSLDGIETGVRQLIRQHPLEIQTLEVAGQVVTLPTEAEMLRIKGALILRRNATRDYLDYIAMATHLGDRASAAALGRFDEYYPQVGGESALQQLLVQLAKPMPFDLGETHLVDYKNLDARWHRWESVQAAAGDHAAAVFKLIA